MKKRNLLLLLVGAFLLIPMTVNAIMIEMEVSLVGKDDDNIKVGEKVTLKAEQVAHNDLALPDIPYGETSRIDVTSTTVWESEDPSIATVVNGQVVGIAPGTVKINADDTSIETPTGATGKYGSITVTVVEATEEPDVDTPAEEPQQDDSEQVNDIPDTAARKDLIILAAGLAIAVIGSSITITTIAKRKINE